MALNEGEHIFRLFRFDQFVVVLAKSIALLSGNKKEKPPRKVSLFCVRKLSNKFSLKATY